MDKDLQIRTAKLLGYRISSAEATPRLFYVVAPDNHVLVDSINYKENVGLDHWSVASDLLSRYGISIK